MTVSDIWRAYRALQAETAELKQEIERLRKRLRKRLRAAEAARAASGRTA